MPSVADVWLDLRTDDKKLGDDIERGARSAKVDRAGRSAGQRFSRGFKSGLGDAGGPLAELSHTLTGFGDATTAASRKANIFKRVVAGVALATGPLESSVSAAVGVTGALAAGLTAAGVGLGAYGAAAAGVLNNIGTLANLQKQAATGSKLAASRYQATLKTLSPPLRQFWKELQTARQSYLDWSKSLSGPVLAPMSTGLKVVNPLLRELTPFVREASKALNQLATEAVQAVTGSGFKEWLSTMLPLVRPVLVGIGHAIGNIIAGFGGITTAFAPFVMKVIGGLEQLTRHFREWAADLGSHTGFQAMISQWRDMWPQVQQALGQVLIILKNVVSAWASMTTGGNSKWLWEVANPILAIGRMLSGNPALVQMLTYLYLIGKGAGQIKGVFGVLQKGLGLITGRGGAVVGMEAAGATMMAASRNMLTAAGLMQRGGFMVATGKGAPVPLPGKAGAAVEGAILGGPVTAVATGLLFGLAVGYLVNHSSDVQRMIAAVNARNARNNITPAREAAGRQVFGRAGGVDTSAWKRYDAAASAAAAHVQSAWARARGEVEKFNSAKLGGMFTATAKTAEAARKAVGTFTTAVADMGTKDARTVQARQTLINDLERTGVKSGTAERDVAKLATAIARHGQYSDQARAARLRLNKDIEQAFKDSQQGRADMDRLTAAIKDHGVKSDQAQSARKRLINDLVDAGVDADTARGMVRKMISAIADIKGKHVDITVSGMGQFTVAQVKSLSRAGGKLAGPLSRAAGGFIPGYGGGDRHLTLLESGEAVVSKETTRAHAATLRAWGVPGMASGGLMPSYRDGTAGLGQWAASNVTATVSLVARKTGEAMEAGVRKAMRAAADQMAKAAAGGFGPAGPVSQSAAAAMRYARSLFGFYGWGPEQWPPLFNLWMGESGWRWDAYNASSGATGIPQALPGSKMASAGPDWRTNANTQVRWGEGYINQVYRNPANAYGLWLSRNPHWYGGGLSARFTRPTVIGVGERGPEDVLAVPAGGAGAFRGFGKGQADPMGRVETLLSRLIGAVERQPARTGAAVSDALDSVSRTASYRAAYSAR